MLTDIKRSKAHLAKIIQFGGFLSKMIGNVIGKLDKALTKFAVSLSKNILPQLATKATSSLIDNCKEK